MNGRLHWQNALNAAQEIEPRQRDRWVLFTLAQLPFLSEEILEQLAGVKGRGLYRTVGRLLKSGLVAAIAPPLTADHSPRLLYLTDLGVAALAVLHQVEPEPLTQRLRITRRHLIRLIPGLPALQDAYQLLGAIAVSDPGPSTVARWEWPWRRRYVRATNKGPVWIRLPAFAELAWDGRQLQCLLVPDRGHMPMRAYRPALGHLLSMRAIKGGNLPPLIIATNEGRRSDAWQVALRETAVSRGEGPLTARFATWTDLPGTLQGLDAFIGHSDGPVSPRDVVPSDLPALIPRPSAGRIPQIIGSLLGTPKAVPRADERLAHVTVAVSPSDRELLGLVGRHPFLSCAQLAALFHRPILQIRRQRKRLTALGLVRVVAPEEVPQRSTKKEDRLSPDVIRGLELAELTDHGLALVAAHWGFTVAVARQADALVGGGPEKRLRVRSGLLSHIRHTLEANGVCIDLLLATLRLAKTEGHESPVATWCSAAACARGTHRPDGYVMIDRSERSFGFFLEYDRGTESARDYRRKFTAYYDYRDSSRFVRDYHGFPTILIVTSRSEKPLVEAFRAVSVGRDTALSCLLTTVGWIEDHPQGLLGPIWRDPWSAVRRAWLLSACARQHQGTWDAKQRFNESRADRRKNADEQARVGFPTGHRRR